MPISTEDIDYLEKKLDDRYRKITDCDDIHEDVDENLSEHDKKIELVAHDISSIKRVAWLIFSTLLSGIIIEIVGGFLHG